MSELRDRQYYQIRLETLLVKLLYEHIICQHRNIAVHMHAEWP